MHLSILRSTLVIKIFQDGPCPKPVEWTVGLESLTGTKLMILVQLLVDNMRPKTELVLHAILDLATEFMLQSREPSKIKCKGKSR